jgi:hypothetical protein
VLALVIPSMVLLISRMPKVSTDMLHDNASEVVEDDTTKEK